MSREDKRRRDREERRVERVAASTAKAADDGPLVRERTNPKEFLGEVRSELRKVAWPSRREVVVYTTTVLLVTTVLTLIVYGMDEVLREMAQRFL